MQSAIIFDCEFLVSEGAPGRFWCGPYDPDPVIAQIGAARITLGRDAEIGETFRAFITPVDRHGEPYRLSPLFTDLTGITEETIAAEGLDLGTALTSLAEFAGADTLWSWGKDEFNMMAISCYVAGITPVLPATRFDNACKLLLRAGMPYEDVKKTRSNALVDHFAVEHSPLRGHDALDDALSVAYVIRHLLRAGTLQPADFQ